MPSLGPQLAREILGRIVDPQGDLLEELRSPFDGLLMARRTFLSVTPGEIVFTLFRPTTPPVTE
jgi:predicted deacylase